MPLSSENITSFQSSTVPGFMGASDLTPKPALSATALRHSQSAILHHDGTSRAPVKTAIFYRLYMDLYFNNFTRSLSENLETIKFDYKDKTWQASL
ncbi:hypothetical protein EC957_004046 [Mortierella hygrophila]|uniref:Uncharacterized protein n=1 Tax=Mortierella hygrophila TaxID=979708 RepID=A0A9P6F1U4_9FUNG|nr:hypothetical protein EC957_004046 [Mortierella hygrophila]